jgi:hypothetical protein
VLRSVKGESEKALLAISLAPSVARAGAPTDEDDLGGYRTRRTYESPQSFAFELRFGPYRPEIDRAFATAQPYASTCGDDHHLAFGAELDWQAVRIPYIGTLGLGAAWNYVSMSANAKLRSTGEPSAETTKLKIMPMYGVGVLRIDQLARETAIPIVAYGKAGVGYALWSASNDLGVSEWTDPKTGEAIVGRGRTLGTHVAVGGMLLLDSFNPGAAAQLDQNTGVNNTYLFFEWMRAKLDGFEDHKSLRVGTTTWVTGLAFEM